MNPRHRHRPLSAGPSTRRHRRASRRVALARNGSKADGCRASSGRCGRRRGAGDHPQPAADHRRHHQQRPRPGRDAGDLDRGSPPPQGVTGPLTYQFDFFDNGNFEVANQSGVASWTYNGPGLHVLDVRVIDSLGDRTDALTFVIVTTPKPTVTPPADQPAVEGVTTEFAVGRFSQTGGAGPWNVTVDWGDETTSTFTTTTAGDLGSLPHTYSRYGDYPVTVTVSDGTRSGSATFGAHVANVAPAVAAPPDQTATEGSSSSFALGRFADTGAESPWIVTVDWGDNTAPTTFGAGAAATSARWPTPMRSTGRTRSPSRSTTARPPARRGSTSASRTWRPR